MADNKLLGAGGLYYGGNEISKAYMGNNLVWEKTVEIDYSKEYFCVEALENCKVQICTQNAAQIIYCITDSQATSMDVYNTIQTGGNTYQWSSFNANSKVIYTLSTITANQKIYILSNCTAFGSGSNEDKQRVFRFNGRVNLSGNVMSLTHGLTQQQDLCLPTELINKQYNSNSQFVLLSLFKQNKTIIDASNLILSSPIVGWFCYQYMFYGCTSLIAGPLILPATLNYRCYYQMFYGCTSLTTAPELPPTTLAQECYYMMFENCTSLTTAPVLPALRLTSECYYRMFYGCSKLNYIKAMFTTTPSSNYTNNWLYHVSSTGTFVKNSSATWNVTGTSGIPSGWTVQTASA